MAASKSLCIYLPDHVHKELDEMMDEDGIDNKSQYIKDVLHLTSLAGGMKALEARLFKESK